MKRIAYSLLFFTLVSSIYGDIVEAPINRVNFHAKIEKWMNRAKKKAKSYEIKADKEEKKGNSALAETYRNCSESSSKIAKAIENYEKAKSRAEAICQGHRKLMSYYEQYVDYYKDKETLTERAEKLRECKEMCLKEAKGKSFTHQNYKQFAEQLELMAVSLEEFKESTEKLKAEKEKLKA